MQLLFENSIRHFSFFNTQKFEQEHIARAAEIGLGATSASEIEIVSANAESHEYHERVAQILSQG